MRYRIVGKNILRIRGASREGLGVEEDCSEERASDLGSKP